MDSTSKIQFEQEQLLHFWLKAYIENPEVSDQAVKILMPFVTTYLCKRFLRLTSALTLNTEIN